MTDLRKIGNQEFLHELKERVEKKQLKAEEVFLLLEKLNRPKMITKYKKVDYSKLTAEDWKKACKALEKDENYQKEIALWDSIGDE